MRLNDDVRHIVILGGGSAGWLDRRPPRARAPRGRARRPRRHAGRVPQHPAHRRRRRHLAVDARHAAPHRPARDHAVPRMRRVVQAGLAFRRLDARRERGRGRPLPPPVHAAAGLRRRRPGGRLAAAPRRPAVRGGRERAAAGMRGRPRAQAGVHARVRGRGQLRLPLRRRQVRRAAARARRREPARAARARRRRRDPLARRRRHRRAAHPPQRRHRRRPVHRLLGPGVGADRPALRHRRAFVQAPAVQRHRARAAGALRHGRRADRHARPSPPRNRPAGRGTSACPRDAASATSIPAPTCRTTRPCSTCMPTSAAPAARPTSPSRAASRSTPAGANASGTATASPWACRPASSSRSRPRRWRWWSCRRR